MRPSKCTHTQGCCDCTTVPTVHAPQSPWCMHHGGAWCMHHGVAWCIAESCHIKGISIKASHERAHGACKSPPCSACTMGVCGACTAGSAVHLPGGTAAHAPWNSKVVAAKGMPLKQNRPNYISLESQVVLTSRWQISAWRGGLITHSTPDRKSD